ncbi:general stress protein [Aureibacillus halotolerans]|uniref:Heat induced stress protein YflT n=1 Tax=Aureibacillus halotolerans TaxID=1508390 RepID=A0A4R6U8Z0_9BACI|nr:general stress protein [Aureibacillus halotolerans]TDQ42222.1 heat induced stress protein YflT [Aureibacillus halotolerans]
MTKPYVREYTDDVKLVEDVKELQSRGVEARDVFILTHDDDRTERVAEKADANTIGLREQGLTEYTGNIFRKKGDELRSKMKEIGLSAQEAEMYEEKMDHGSLFVFVTDSEKAAHWATS